MFGAFQSTENQIMDSLTVMPISVMVQDVTVKRIHVKIYCLFIICP